MNIGSSELLIILVLVIVVFGGSQIPKLARSLGRAQKEFKAGIEEGDSEPSAVKGTTVTPPVADGHAHNHDVENGGHSH